MTFSQKILLPFRVAPPPKETLERFAAKRTAPGHGDWLSRCKRSDYVADRNGVRTASTFSGLVNSRKWSLLGKMAS
jgi:hypothetical protein